MTSFCSLGLVVAVSVAMAGGSQAAYHSDAIEACASLTRTQKLGMMRGYGEIDGYTRNSGCGDLCGRKTFRWDNGPQGFGDNVPPGTSTQWPSTLNMAATWDPELALEWGTAMGEEFWGKGTNIQEGPGINVARVMRNGRNFEYISGEDPVLGSRMVVPVVQGIQKNVMAIAKHFILNNQETHRSGVNELIDEKTLMELYGPPFRAAVQEAAGVMCAYNRINGDYACENELALQTILKERYAFEGFVVSDWGATHSTNQSLHNGLDIEMPMAHYFTEENINASKISNAEIEDRCVRILSGYFKLPEDKRHPCGGGICIENNVSTAEHKVLARKLAVASSVLLKNEGNILPLERHANAKRTIALIGADATDKAYTAGGGSGSVKTNAVVGPVTALKNAIASGAVSNMEVTLYDGNSTASAATLAKDADIAVVFASAHTSEGSDRADLHLHGNMDDVIATVAASNSKTVVVLSVPGSILTDWRDDVAAILYNGLPGEQVGPAVVDLLFGFATPSGRLPVTFPGKENEQGMTEEQFPGVKTQEFDLQCNYTEGQINGYRWYSKHAVDPAYPFGHGLTYGPAFSFSDLEVDGRRASFTVEREASDIDGCTVAQIYLSFPDAESDADVPSFVLRGFEKICSPGKGKAVSERITVGVSSWNDVM